MSYTSEHFNFVSFRKNGKVHRGLVDKDGSHLKASCTCPGSRNGRLTNGASILLTNEDREIGWKLANCEN